MYGMRPILEIALAGEASLGGEGMGGVKDDKQVLP